MCLPAPAMLTSPGILEYGELGVVRSKSPGFVQRVAVRDGQSVELGELLVELRNEDVEKEYRDLLHRIEQSRIRQRIAMDDHEASQAQVELGNELALLQQLEETRSQREGLAIRAPVEGRVVSRDLDQTLGTYVDEGQELLAIGQESKKEASLSIGHREVQEIRPYVGRDVLLRIGSRTAIRGVLSRIDPRASTELREAAMAATEGGPLAVTQGDDSRDKLRLAEPHFRAIVTLPSETARRLRAGERGYAIMGWQRKTLGMSLYTAVTDWIDDKLEQVQQ